MSTRSCFALVNHDDTVRACYVHFDGYPSGVGAELVKDFSTPELINARLDKGSGSTLYDGFYKDRGEDEEDVGAKTFADVAHYLKQTRWSDVEYQYLFRDGVWYAYERGWGSERATPLGTVAEAIALEKSD